MKTALVIGGGIAGCAATHQLMKLGGWDITIVEAAPFLGAGVRTFWYGGHPYTFGPRHFLTQNRAVYDYMDAIVPLRSCADHQFITYVEPDNAFYNYPIHEDDIALMPDSAKIAAERLSARGVAEAKYLE
jgi:UDP-galactopyranose mutase